jgi:DNA-binding response OmpR family regulator
MVPHAKLLVIDRDNHIIRWLRSHLKSDSFAVLAASDGSSALDWIRGEAPDLVLTEFMPPMEHPTEDAGQAQMDSFQFLRRLRLESNVAVIVLSRERDEALKLYFLDSGADDYLTWPCHRRELLARIRAVLRRTRRAAPGWEQPASAGLGTHYGQR